MRDYLDVFLEEISELLPDRKMESAIELLPGITPTSQAPYRMVPRQLSKLKEQLKDLVFTGYIRPNVSP